MYNANNEELEILKFWDKDQTFKKSVESRPENKPYVFYDGPPFATGLPHYGHILSSVIKDVVPRYYTMKGYRVRRRWGWDCHGLPIENLIEKELKISGKKEIDAWGIEKFNEACRSKVLMYTQEWKKMVDRIGRWVEFDNSYKTMDATYMESVWWALKTIWDKGLIYEGRKVLMYCPHCETPVSKAEIAMDNSYRDITEESAIAKFKIKEEGTRNKEQFDVDGPVYILAWTTTPWTLPGNVALAVGKNIFYSLVESNGEHYIVASDLIEKVFKKEPAKEIKQIKGSELVGLEYEPLFNMPAMAETGKKGYYVAEADFVTTVDGTGIVHTAVIYGEDDYNLGLKLDLPMVPMLNEKGEFNETAPEFIRGAYFKQAEKEIKKDLEKRGLLFSREQYTHSYPHCWRCDTQLFYNAISAWFINIQKVKGRMIELNQKINWFPEHLKNGRFLNILETAPDWNISRNRYWATPLPFWKCENKEPASAKAMAGKQENNCDNVVCIGSVAELKEKAINFDHVFSTDKVEELDLHKHIVDQIKLKCDKCGGVMERIPEVIDCWVESSSMPFAEFHYPFENETTFKNRFPGQYIAEYINQTRAWFYYMHTMAVLLFDDISFENVVCTGEIQNEKGEKLSKSKKNYPDPWLMIEQYGIDAIRYYMMTSPVMEADNLLFNEREVKDIYNKVLNILSNVVSFYQMYASESSKLKVHSSKSANVLDKWIMARLHQLIKEVTQNMDAYSTVKAGRPIKDFIDDLSTWYVRRSRDRFKGSAFAKASADKDDEQDKQHALGTLREVLGTLAKLMAPFTPFMAEKVWQSVHEGTSESVHLQAWPEYYEEHHQQAVLDEMALARKMVEMGLALRAENKLKVRQPLLELRMNKNGLSHELLSIVADELNVKKVDFAEAVAEQGFAQKQDGPVTVWLATTVTPELKKEGVVREVIRTINQLRKDNSLTVHDTVGVTFDTKEAELTTILAEYSQEIQKATLSTSIQKGELLTAESVMVDGKEIKLVLTKV